MIESNSLSPETEIGAQDIVLEPDETTVERYIQRLKEEIYRESLQQALLDTFVIWQEISQVGKHCIEAVFPSEAAMELFTQESIAQARAAKVLVSVIDGEIEQISPVDRITSQRLEARRLEQERLVRLALNPQFVDIEKIKYRLNSARGKLLVLAMAKGKEKQKTEKKGIFPILEKIVADKLASLVEAIGKEGISPKEFLDTDTTNDIICLFEIHGIAREVVSHLDAILDEQYQLKEISS